MRASSLVTSMRIRPVPYPVQLEYISRNFHKTDTNVEIYNSYKLSVLFTDGMAAVLDGQTHEVVRGDILIFRPEEIHFGRILRPGLHRFLTLLIPIPLFTALGGESLTYVFSDTSPDRVNQISPSCDGRAEVLRLSQLLVDLADSDDPARELRFFAGLIDLLVLCQELYCMQKQHPIAAIAPAIVSDALQYINKSYPDISGLSEISGKVGCSVTYLTRMFHRYTGKTVYGYLTECRLCHAKNMLKAGVPVTEVCYRTGFGDCSNFIKAFRHAEGVTPLQYGKRNRMDQT